MKEVLYHLTTECIRTGNILLTPGLKKLFGDARQVVVYGPRGGTCELTIVPEERRVEGLSPLFATDVYEANDVIRFVREGDRISVEPVGRRVRRRTDLPKVEVKKSEPPRKTADVTPYPKEMLYPETGKRPLFVEALSALGLDPIPQGKYWRFRARMGRKGFTLVAAREGQTTQDELKAAKAQHDAQYALWIAADERPKPVPGLVVAGEGALRRLADLHRSFPIGAMELMRLFNGGRVGLDEVERLTREVASLLGERAQFSAVLLGLSNFRKDQVFLLEDLEQELGEQLSKDQIYRILEVLAGPPFFAVEKTGDKEYRLRDSVEQILDALAAYATQLKRRLPTAVAAAVRG